MAKSSPLASPAEDFPRWYQDVVAKAELADNGPVRGTMVVRPYGYALWEAMQQEVDARIKAAGAQNAYFPMFIPMSYLEKESDHVEGFSPELAIVTHGGGKELEEPAVVRPTSETIINAFFAKWVQSYRDLPLLINQWANVVRWEMRPRVFLRTSEFLWQEGHTAHATQAEAAAYALRILTDVYQDFMVNVLAIPVLSGLKSPAESFPGALRSLCCEAMMRDGKALQMATSHELGQNFSRMFDISYSDQDGNLENVWQTSWGCSTRMVGGLIMAHGDEKGLVIPPKLAPTQVVILIVRDGEGVTEAAEDLKRRLAGELGGAALGGASIGGATRGGASLQGASGGGEQKILIDSQTAVSFGRRSTDWEIKGVPVRMELGPRDVEEGVGVLVRRDTSEKTPVPLQELPQKISATLQAQQNDMLAAATAQLEARTQEAATIEEAAEIAQQGFARIPWNSIGAEGETALAAKGVSVRCLLRQDNTTPATIDDPDLVAIVGRAY